MDFERKKRLKKKKSKPMAIHRYLNHHKYRCMLKKPRRFEHRYRKQCLGAR
jgi:hypothetical protein